MCITMVSSIFGISAFIGSVLGLIGAFTGNYIFLVIGGCIVLIQCSYEVFFGAQNSFATEIVFAIIGIIISRFINLAWWQGLFLGLCLDEIILGGIDTIAHVAFVLSYFRRGNKR